MSEVAVYDPALFRKALELDDDDGDGFVGPEEERPFRTLVSRTTEGDVWARCLQKILDDPRGHTRPGLHGDEAMASRLVEATSTMSHFAAVTGIVERAVVQSSRTRRPIRFPPMLMVSPPGVGKTFYCRAVAGAMATTCVPIAINGTSDRGQLGGLSSAWRGAKLGKIAKGLLVDSATAAPLYLLDELDKPPALIAGENTLDVLLSALEPENARAFVDEYLDVPIALDSALWLASANDTRAIPEPLLSRMVVVDVPAPTPSQAAIVVRAVASPILRANGLASITDAAVEALLDLSARRARQALEIAAGFAVCGRREVLAADDVRRSLALLERRTSRPMGFLL